MVNTNTLGSKGGGESYSSIPGIDAKSRLSLLFILSLAPGDFPLGSPVVPSPQKPSLQIQMSGVH